MDDWDDMDQQAPVPRRPSGRRRETGGLTRNQRFAITLAVTAAFMLIVGLVVGFSIGRAVGARSAAKTVSEVTTPAVTPSVTPTEVTTTETEPATVAVTPTVTTQPAAGTSSKTRQLRPADGDRIDASHVDIAWTKVTPPSGETVTYSFQIETLSSGSWGDLQTITGLHSTSYSVRVLTALRRWRVWAVVGGSPGPKTGWRTYRHTAVSSSKPSTTTTSE